MRWHKPSLKVIHSFWGQRARTERSTDERIEGVRHAMLEATPHAAPGEPHGTLFSRIHHAPDLEALWYLRSDLMAAIAAQHGEATAREQLAGISPLFEGLIPQARMPTGTESTRRRPSRPD